MIHLNGYADEVECLVTIKHGETVVYQEKVPAGTAMVTFSDECEPGNVTYTVIVAENAPWEHTEVFGEAG